MWKYVVIGIAALIALCSLWPNKPNNLEIVDLTLVAMAEREPTDLRQLFDAPHQVTEAQAREFLQTVEKQFWPVVYSPHAAMSPAELAPYGMKSPLEWFTEPVAKLVHQEDLELVGSIQMTTPLEPVDGRRGLLVLYTRQNQMDLLAIELRREPEIPHEVPAVDQPENAERSKPPE